LAHICSSTYGILVSNSLPVQAGTEYQVYAWVKGELDAEDSLGDWIMRAQFYDTNGSALSYISVDYGALSGLSTTWQQQGGRFTAPANAATMKIQLWNYMNSGWVAFDDVSVSAEVTTNRYYYLGGKRLAMRTGGGSGATGLKYLLSDHLGSTTMVLNSSGGMTAEVRYKAWGSDRYTSGTAPTDFRYSGQRIETELGLYWYGSRWYDNALGRFAQPDTVVPNLYDPPDLDRYSYVRNSPVDANDPSGHIACDGEAANKCTGFDKSIVKYWEVKIIQAADYSETSNGTYPEHMDIIAWVYLNRFTSGTYPSIAKAVGPGQSALITALQDDFPWLENWKDMSDYELEMKINEMSTIMYQRSNNVGWKNAMNVAQGAVIDYELYGSDVDPTGGATDFVAVNPEKYNFYVASYEARKNDTKGWPGYHYSYVGPFWGGPVLGRYTYLFFDNRSKY
jgi:RHS repeat-associated protein